MGEQKENTLFPILQQDATSLTGMAKLAAEAIDAGSGHLVRFHAMPVRSALNRSVSKRKLPFARTINPYRGCEFACRYCYARYTHEFLNFSDPAAFEQEIYIKQNLDWLLEQELRGFDPAEEIAIGTATDPYQPIERTAEVTRSVLEVLARQSGLRIGIVTKSTLIERDVDLLTTIAARNRLTLHITITTTDAVLARKLEPRAPRPDLRFRTVKRLRAAGLTTGVLCSPLLPGITDNGPALNLVAKRAAEAGASFSRPNRSFSSLARARRSFNSSRTSFRSSRQATASATERTRSSVLRMQHGSARLWPRQRSGMAWYTAASTQS